MTIDIWAPGTNVDGINVSNRNGKALLDLVGIGDPANEGEWTVEQLPAVRERIEMLLGSQGRRVAAVRPTERYRNVIDFGIDDSYVRERLSQMLVIVNAAIEARSKVVWT